MDYIIRENKKLKESYYRIKHSSGLTLLVFPKKGYNSVYASIGTKFGSIYSSFMSDGRKITVPDGTAHYLEHKLFESEDGDAFSKYAKTGASANAYTSFDTTCYLFSCTDHFRQSLEILIDLIQSPYFTKETVAKEQGIISQEIKMYDDSPDWRVMMNLLMGMYKEHPINKDIAGTVETIAEITPEILYDCYNSYYNLNNMVMAVSGGVDPYEVLEIIDKKIKPDKPVETSIILPEEPYGVARGYTQQILPVTVPLFELGFKEACGRESASGKELICTSILLDMFIGESSSLYRELTDKKLINSGFGSEYMEGLGYRSVILSGESRDPSEVSRIIREAAAELHHTGIDEQALERSKRAVYGRMVSTFDSKQAIAAELINGEFYGREIFEPVDILEKLTADDINSRLRDQLDPENTCLSVVKGE